MESLKKYVEELRSNLVRNNYKNSFEIAKIICDQSKFLEKEHKNNKEIVPSLIKITQISKLIRDALGLKDYKKIQPAYLIIKKELDKIDTILKIENKEMN